MRGLFFLMWMLGPQANQVYFHGRFVTFSAVKHLMTEDTNKEFSLEALRAGDKAEFARLVEAYSTPIYRLALRMLANPQEAEDVLQTTFLKAFQHLKDFEGRSSISTWLYRIAANEALMLLRRRRPELPLEDEPEEGQLPRPFQFADWAQLPEGELLSGEAKKILDRAIQNLPEKLRVVFLSCSSRKARALSSVAGSPGRMRLKNSISAASAMV